MSTRTDVWSSRAGTVLRAVGSVPVAGIVGTLFWLIVMQEGVARKWTKHDDVAALGRAFGASDNDPSKRGFFITLLAFCAVAAIVAVLARWLPRAIAIAAAAVALPIFLAWGLVVGPMATDRAPEIPSGVFALDGGVINIVLGVIASYLASLALLRTLRIMESAQWWRPGRDPVDTVSAEGLLELPEQGREERDKLPVGEADNAGRARAS